MNKFKAIIKVDGHDIEVEGTLEDADTIHNIDKATLLDREGKPVSLPDFLQEEIDSRVIYDYKYDRPIMDALRDQAEAHKDDAAETKRENDQASRDDDRMFGN